MKKEWLKYILTAVNIILVVIFILIKQNLSSGVTTFTTALVASTFILLLLIFKTMKINFIHLLQFILLQVIILVSYLKLVDNQGVIISSLLTIISFIVVGLIIEKKNRNKYTFILYSLVIYLLFQSQINEVTLKLSSLDIEAVRDYIDSFGVFAPIISMLLMVLQSIIAPVPAFLITFANALVFGWVKGAIISWTGAMIGASICFAIGRYLGRDVAVKYAGKKQLDAVDGYFKKYGKLSILVARLLPFVPFDPISYGAGLTSMSFSGFFIATGLGQLPATIIYSYFAGNITAGGKGILWAMCAMFIISATVITLKKNKGENNE